MITRTTHTKGYLLTSKKRKPRQPIVPMSSPDLTEAEREAVAAVMRTPYLSMGPEIDKFEKSIQAYTGSKHAIAVSSGTTGLHLCVRAAGIDDGDLVITTPFSFVASTNVILYERAVPVFVDADPVTGNIDPQLIRQAVNDLAEWNSNAKKWLPRRGFREGAPLKAILPIDVFGQPADMDPIMEVARQFELTVIEDSCEALGAMYKDRHAGTLGDFGVYAFYPNKQITTSEGGVVVTADDEAATMIRSLRNQGRSPGDTWLQHTHLGYNYRLNELCAALGRTQMERLDELLAKREQVADWYNQRIPEIPGFEVPKIVPDTSRMSWFVYVVRLAQGIDRDEIAGLLQERGVPVRPYFLPIHLQPYMVERFGYQKGDFPVTESLGRSGLALPFSSVMTEAQVALVCKELRRVLTQP
jgi:perosamine synthetase